MDPERDEREPGPERCRDLFDDEHLEQIFATVRRAEESAWITMLEGPDVHVSRSDFERPFLWHRSCAQAEDVPVEVITRFISTSRQKEFSPFIKSEELHAELRPPDPGDPDGLGRVVVNDLSAVFFGFNVVEKRLYATRRLPDGTGVGIKVPVDFLDGRWTTRKWAEKFVPLVAFRSEITARGSRFTAFYKEKPTIGFFPFFPTSIISQILLRICAKMILQFRRTHVAKWQAAATAARRPARRLLFASGSAAPPLHLSSPTFSLDPPAAERSPFVVHACSPRVQAPSPDSSPELATGLAYRALEPPPPPSRDTNNLFLDLIGIEEPPAASDEPRDPNGRVFLLSNSQLVKTGTYTETAGFRSVLSEAVRASLDLSIHMEALSLGVAPPAPPPGQPPAPAPAPASEAQPGKERARPRPEEGGEAAAATAASKKEKPCEAPPQPPAKPKRDPSHRKPRPPPQPYQPPRPILAKPAAPEPRPPIVEPAYIPPSWSLRIPPQAGPAGGPSPRRSTRSRRPRTPSSPPRRACPWGTTSRTGGPPHSARSSPCRPPPSPPRRWDRFLRTPALSRLPATAPLCTLASRRSRSPFSFHPPPIFLQDTTAQP